MHAVNQRDPPDPTSPVLRIHDLLRPEAIDVALRGRDKAGVIDALVALLEGAPAVRDLEGVRGAVHAREERMSTGVGKGLALPHAKTNAVKETVAAFAIAEHAVPFGAIDDQPVRLLFLLVGREDAGAQHIKILSRVSRLMNSDAFREQLLRAETPQAVLDAFRQAETEILEL